MATTRSSLKTRLSSVIELRQDDWSLCGHWSETIKTIKSKTARVVATRLNGHLWIYWPDYLVCCLV